MHVIAPFALFLPAASRPDCDDAGNRRGTWTSVSSHSHDDDSASRVVSYRRSDSDRCESASLVGRVTFSDAEDDVTAMAFGSHAAFMERTGSGERAITFSRGPDGEVMRSFQRDGRAAPFDAAAQRWLAAFMPRVLASASINVKPRVARWRAQGGVDNVLTRIAEIDGSGSRRAHYEALLDDERLSDDELDRTLRSVSDHMRGSSGDLRSVLTRLAPRVRLSARTVPSLEAAMRAIASSGDRAAVLKTYGALGGRDLLLAVMRVTATVPSSGDRATVLRQLTSRYLDTGDRELHEAYFAAARGIPSSGDLRGVLVHAIPYARGDANVTRLVISGTRAIASSGDKSSVLIELVSSGAVQGEALRDAFFDAAAQVPSDGDRSRVLQAAARATR